jgi:hypothetical protein
MSHEENVALPPEQERVLVTAFAEVVVGQAAPEELVLFDETAAEFLEDPSRVLNTRSRDEPVGFGLELELLTPYVLAVLGPVVGFLVSVVADSIKEGAKTTAGELVRALFKRKAEALTADPEPVPELTTEQVHRVHQIAYERSIALGLPDATATLLADSVVGGVQVAG